MYQFVKRTVDLSVSVIGLIVLAPLFLIIGIAIKVDTKGPIFFRQARVGLRGKPFQVYKFRSMVVGAQTMGTGLFNYEGDPRVTKVGHFLRETSLDELPQLLNIVKGEMAVVGPRPCVVGGTLGDYEDWPPQYKKRVEVRPGVTGLAQVNGRNALSWEEKIVYDDEYVDALMCHGFTTDIKILLKTIKVVFSRESIYETRVEDIDAEEAARCAAVQAMETAQKQMMEKEEQYVR